MIGGIMSLMSPLFRRFVSVACFLLIFVGCEVFFSSNTSAARNPLFVTISPVTLNIVTEPGKPVVNVLRVRNNGIEPEKLNFSLGTFTADRNGDKPILVDADPNAEFMQWMHFDRNNIDVQPGEWGAVTRTCAPPVTAGLSYYYTVYVSRVDTGIEQVSGELPVAAKPAFLVLTSVTTPDMRKELRLSDFFVNFPIVEYLPETFTYIVQNTGNVHAAPSGTLFIEGWNRQNLATVPINPSSGMVLPNSQRTFQLSWKDGFPVYQEEEHKEGEAPSKDGQPKKSVLWDWSHADRFRIGPYTARLIMVYDNGERDVPFEGTAVFWVIPWKIILAALALISLVCVGLYSVFKNMFGGIGKRFRRVKTRYP
jgi:hypothetical protein